MFRNVPLSNPQPDAKRFIDVILGRADGSKPPLIEYIVDPTLTKPITTDLLGREWIDPAGDRESLSGYLDNFIQFWYRMGYDFVRFETAMPFPRGQLIIKDTGADKDRAWVDEHNGPINSWEDFEKYPWPKVEEADFYIHEYINANMPDGMGLMTCHAGGMYEHLSYLFSYEKLCYALFDNRDLVRAVTDRLGELMAKYYEHLLDFDRVTAIFPGDDMGFKSGTLIGPDDLREFILPWHKKFAEMTHEKGLSYFLHSCGNLESIMEDLIEDVKIDAKHSYEDVIIPIDKFQEKYGDRIGVLGGVDVDILSVGSPEDVRKRVRHLLETCGARGRFALGAGNSVPSYIPLENYLTMVDEVNGFKA